MVSNVKYICIYLLFSCSLYSFPPEIEAIPSGMKSYWEIHRFYKDYNKHKEYLRLMFFFLVKERHNCGFQDISKEEMALLQDVQSLLQYDRKIQKLYVDSHKDIQSLYQLGNDLEKYRPRVDDYFDQLCALSHKCD